MPAGLIMIQSNNLLAELISEVSIKLIKFFIHAQKPTIRVQNVNKSLFVILNITYMTIKFDKNRKKICQVSPTR